MRIMVHGHAACQQSSMGTAQLIAISEYLRSGPHRPLSSDGRYGLMGGALAARYRGSPVPRATDP